MNVWVAVGLIAGPIAVGFVAGAVLRRVFGRGLILRAALWLAVVVAPLPAALLLGETFSVGVWDAAMRVWLCLVAAAMAVSAANDRLAVGNLLLAVAAAGFTLLSIELMLRAFTDLRPMPATEVTGFAAVHAAALEPICGAIYGDSAIRDRGAGDGDLPVILHVGDSMVYGIGAGGMDNAFPRHLGAKDVAHRHVNAGYWGSSIDGQWLLLRHWLPQVPARLVVHYVFLGNDIHELDRASICCGMRSLVTGEGRPRCEIPVYDLPPALRLSLSPAPLEIRLAASQSVLATQTVVSLKHLGSWLMRTLRLEGQPPLPIFYERQFDRFAQIERSIRDAVAAAGAELVVVLLVPRESVAIAIGREAIAVDLWSGEGMVALERVRAILAELGVDVIDTSEIMFSMVSADTADEWFARDMPGDFHFSARGHAAFADWLWPRLEARLTPGDGSGAVTP